MRAYFLQSGKSEQPVIEVPLCTDHQPHSRTASAPKARSAAEVKEKYVPPTRTNQNPPFDAGTFITHQTKTQNRSRECRFPPEYQSPGENPKRGQGPRFGRPKEWGFPRGEDRAKGPFPLGVSLVTFCTRRKRPGSGPGRPGDSSNQGFRKSVSFSFGASAPS